MPRVLVLLDGYPGFVSAFDRVNAGAFVDAVPRLIADGRAVGLHFAITGDRRGSIPNAIASIVPGKVALRMADEDDYAALGFDLRQARGVALPKGRGFVEATLEVQIAVLGSDPSGEGQAAAVAELAATLRASEPGAEAPRIQPLPATVARAHLPKGTLLRVPLGIGDTELGPVFVDLSERHFLVSGPYRSGRTTALWTIAAGLRAADPALELHLLAPRRSDLPDLPVWQTAARGLDACNAAAAELLERVRARTGTGEAPFVVVVDDGEELADASAGSALELIIRRGRDVGVRVVIGAERAGARAFIGWPREIKKEEHGFLLQPDDTDGDILSVRLPRRNTVHPAGRGFLVSRGSVELVQIAGD